MYVYVVIVVIVHMYVRMCYKFYVCHPLFSDDFLYYQIPPCNPKNPKILQPPLFVRVKYALNKAIVCSFPPPMKGATIVNIQPCP